nr:hypothetical protein [Methylorubrum zatmanii]
MIALIRSKPPLGGLIPLVRPFHCMDFKMSKFSWAVKPIHRRRSVTAALLAPRPKSTKAVTMPARTMTMLTDAERRLPDDPVAQLRAEEAIRAAISYRIWQEAKAKTATVQAVEVQVDDDSLAISDVSADVLDGIAAELRRIAGLSGVAPDFRPIRREKFTRLRPVPSHHNVRRGQVFHNNRKKRRCTTKT